MVKRILSLGMVLALLLSALFILPVGAKDIDNLTVSGDDIYYDGVEDGELIYRYVNGDIVADTSASNDDVETADLPSSYDSRNENIVTPVRNQGSEGYCWAFAATGAVETNILKQKLSGFDVSTMHFSEAGVPYYHMTQASDPNSIYYYSYEDNKDKGSTGGWSHIVGEGIFSGLGEYPENVLNYSKIKAGYPEEMRTYSSIRLKNLTDFDFSKGNGDLVAKNAIMQYGGFALSYSGDGYYSNNSVSYYTKKGKTKSGRQGHAVTCIGWDDSYSKNNFSPEGMPDNDGAWLCKNSWGEDYGENGYLWVSYECDGLRCDIFDMETNDTFDNIYQYQAVNDYYTPTNTANVFKANNNEKLESVGLVVRENFEGDVKIYKLKENYTSPIDGTLLDTIHCKKTYRGAYTLYPNVNIQLQKDEYFSIVVFITSGEISASSTQRNTLKKEKSGYYFDTTDNVWKDLVKLTDNYKSFPSIKAYTKNIDGVTKTNLQKCIDDYYNMDASHCKDQELLEKYHLEVENAKVILNKEGSYQTEIDNECCLLNYYYDQVASYYSIKTAEDFLAIYNKATKSEYIPNIIILENDIDLSNKEISNTLTNGKPFFSSFDGNNHKISNLTIRSEGEGTYGASMFGDVENAEIKDLTLDHITLITDTMGNFVANSTKNSIIDNVKITNSTITTLQFGGIATGLICTVNEKTTVKNCSVTNCTLEGERSACALYNYVANEDHVFENVTQSGNTLRSLVEVSNSHRDDPDGITFTTYNKEKYGNEISMLTFTDTKCKLEEIVGCFKNVSKGHKDGSEYYFDLEKGKHDITIEYDVVDTGGYRLDYSFLTCNIGIIEVPFEKDRDKIVIRNNIAGYPINFVKASIFDNYYQPETVNSIFVDNEINITKDIDFRKFVNLESVILGSEIKNIQNNAFSEMKSLKSVSIKGVETIGEWAFSGCSNLKTVEFSNSLKSIGDYAFYKNTLLDKIILPDSVIKVGKYAFSECGPVTIKLGKNLNDIGYLAFGYAGVIMPDSDKRIFIEDFTINGYTEKQKEYANENGLKFVDLNSEDEIMNDKKFDPSVFKYGDIDLDRDITILDATMIQKDLANLTTLNTYQKYNSFVYTEPNSYSIKNAVLIQKYLANLIPTLEPRYAIED